MATYTLHYFPVQGLGELPRLIMEVAGLAYQNTYPRDWYTEKPTLPFGQLPMLIERQADGSVGSPCALGGQARPAAHG